MISMDNISVRFGGFTLLDNISFMVNPRDRVGLVGKNGAGKTTMLRLIAGLQQPSEGKVIISSGETVGYLPQQMVHPEGNTVYEEAMTAFATVLEMEKRMDFIGHELATRTDYESQSYLDLIDELSVLNEQYELQGGSSLHADVEKTLTGLGFDSSDMSRKTSEFSGGWRMRLELAKIILRRPDFILLDEPTNHLDIESIQWLEEFMEGYSGGVVLISHDRAFLDNVTNRTSEISLSKLVEYKVPYSRYVVLRQERRQQQTAAFQNQQKMIKETEEFIDRFRYKATKAVQVQSRIKQLDKVERLEVDEEDTSAIHIKFPPAPRSGTIVMEAIGLTKKYGEKTILDKIDLIIERGERVAFVGRNGEGKTTLSKIIVGELDYSGKLKRGHNVELGYFAQNQDELLDGNKTILDTIDQVAVGEIRTKIRDILGAFLFRGDDVEKKVKVLSGGERSRLSMARLLLQPYNLLVLDEPTNHLDMRSKDILKNALLAYDGTLILVSHDREFLDGLVNKVYEFRDHKIKEHLGGIYDFLHRKKMTSFRELEKKQQQLTIVKQEKPNDNKQLYEKRKEQDKILRKAKSDLARTEQKISELEEAVKKADQLFTIPENLSDQKLFDKYTRDKHELDKLLAEWEIQQNEIERLNSERV
ncbi:MAG: ATP-binding cassette domain-containing protein [Bacteroidales bacterium]|nr:ATP-binding cassette domain-containing protein [Bacteroidales bacterium]